MTTTMVRVTPNRWAKTLLYTLCRGQVLSGPFAGLHYSRYAVGSALGAKLLGTYELELQGFVRSVQRSVWDRVAVVGAAEGYYAVGVARLLEAASADVQVDAFEIEAEGRDAIRWMAAANGVASRVRVHGRCEATDLRAVLDGGSLPLVICDTEGYEQQLLDPEQVPQLERAHILVETHDSMVPGVGALLESRFAATHVVQRIDARRRAPHDFPAGSWWSVLVPSSVRCRLMGENRDAQQYWFCMTPRA